MQAIHVTGAPATAPPSTWVYDGLFEVAVSQGVATFTLKKTLATPDFEAVDGSEDGLYYIAPTGDVEKLTATMTTPSAVTYTVDRPGIYVAKKKVKAGGKEFYIAKLFSVYGYKLAFEGGEYEIVVYDASGTAKVSVNGKTVQGTYLGASGKADCIDVSLEMGQPKVKKEVHGCKDIVAGALDVLPFNVSLQ